MEPLSQEAARFLDAAGFTEGRPGEAITVPEDRESILGGIPGDVPGLDVVLAAIPPDMHPAAVARFLDTPQPDLIRADQQLTPLEWLSGGGDVASVMQLVDVWRWSGA
jgi:hypothetical protein